MRACVRACVRAGGRASEREREREALVDRFLKTVSHGRYAPQSATIQGILKSMYDSFTETLESSTAAEATANSNFESIIAALQKELALGVYTYINIDTH